MIMKPLFSVVLIARNEEKTLPRLLKSLGEFRSRGGEIVLVDTGSTDKTAEIAREAGCKVEEVGERFIRRIDGRLEKEINDKFRVGNEDLIVRDGDKLFDYTSARNFAATLASNDVIATPDADEAYTTLNIDEINKAIEEGIEQFEYDFVFSHLPDGSPEVSFMHCKFYDRRKLKWTGVIHETLVGEAKRKYFGKDVIYLEHYQNRETNRSGYLKGLAIDCFEHPENDRNAHYFGRELLWTNRPKSAIKQLLRHLEIGTWKAERAQSMIFLGDAELQLGNKSKAVEWYNKAYNEEPRRREALLRLCNYFLGEKEWQAVVSYASAALEIPNKSYYADNQEDYTNKPHEYLYLALWYLGRLEDSRTHFDLARFYQPTNGVYLRDYVWYHELPKVSILLPTLGRPEGLKRCLDSIENLIYPKDKIELIMQEDSPRMGVPKRLKKLYNECTGDVIVFASNDIEFTPESVILAAIESSKKGLVAFNTGELTPDKGNICEHFMMTRKLVEQLGEIFNEDFNHVGADNLLWAKADKLGEAMRLETAKVNHYHFSTGKSEMDDTYRLGWDKYESDRELLKKKLSEL